MLIVDLLEKLRRLTLAPGSPAPLSPGAPISPGKPWSPFKSTFANIQTFPYMLSNNVYLGPITIWRCDCIYSMMGKSCLWSRVALTQWASASRGSTWSFHTLKWNITKQLACNKLSVHSWLWIYRTFYVISLLAPSLLGSLFQEAQLDLEAQEDQNHPQGNKHKYIHVSTKHKQICQLILVIKMIWNV